MQINEQSATMALEPQLGSMSTLSSYIHGSVVDHPGPLIFDEQELSAEARLDMYISIAARATSLQVMETAFTIALRTMRALQNASISSTMPTASKLKTCETPILNLALEFAAKSPEWRALIVQMMADNVATGSGHLSINRAKQVLKDIAKKTNFANLVNELKTSTGARRIAAVYLLGWLKHERAIEPLIEALETATRQEEVVIIEMLESHYAHKLPFYLKWRCANRKTPTPALANLMQLMAIEA